MKNSNAKYKIENWVNLRDYDVIRCPIITEKSHFMAEQNKACFKVDLKANKQEIAQAVTALFGVEVKAVNTVLVKGKKRVFRGKAGVRSDFKKAIVTLADGQVIDLEKGIK